MFEFQHPHHIFELLQRGVGHGVEGLFDRWINVQRAKNVNMCVDRAGRHFERGTFQRVRWTGWVSNQWIGYICGKLRDYEFCHCLQLLLYLMVAAPAAFRRSAERRVGKECVRTWRSRRVPD